MIRRGKKFLIVKEGYRVPNAPFNFHTKMEIVLVVLCTLCDTEWSWGEADFNKSEYDRCPNCMEKLKVKEEQIELAKNGGIY